MKFGLGRVYTLINPILIANEETNLSIPDDNSRIYNNETGIFISNDSSTMVRARAYQPNFAPGPVKTECFIAMSSDLASFKSNLPIIIIDINWNYKLYRGLCF